MSEVSTGALMTEWSADDILDLIDNAISDSFEQDWSSMDGAKAVVGALEHNGLRIVPTPEPAADLVERVKQALLCANINAAGLQNPDALARAAIAAMPSRKAAYEDGYTAGELKWAEAMDKQIGIEENLRSQLATTLADVARLREAIECARKAPMIDHRDAANSVYGILEAAIKDTQP